MAISGRDNTPAPGQWASGLLGGCRTQRWFRTEAHRLGAQSFTSGRKLELSFQGDGETDRQKDTKFQQKEMSPRVWLWTSKAGRAASSARLLLARQLPKAERQPPLSQDSLLTRPGQPLRGKKTLHIPRAAEAPIQKNKGSWAWPCL